MKEPSDHLFRREARRMVATCAIAIAQNGGPERGLEAAKLLHYPCRGQLSRDAGEDGLSQHAEPEVAVMLRGESEFHPGPRCVERLYIARRDAERCPRGCLQRIRRAAVRKAAPIVLHDTR
jgi:hypothetical protein